VRSRVSDCVAYKVVGKVRVVRVAVEGELKNAGSGQLELVAQRVDIRSDKAQIFSDKGKGTQFFSYRFEKC